MKQSQRWGETDPQFKGVKKPERESLKLTDRGTRNPDLEKTRVCLSGGGAVSSPGSLWEPLLTPEPTPH